MIFSQIQKYCQHTLRSSFSRHWEVTCRPAHWGRASAKSGFGVRGKFSMNDGAANRSAAKSASGPRRKTEICITVDTEFNIGGTFANSSRYRPTSIEAVDCVVHGREEGLGFLLRVLAEYGARAVFFVEVLQTFYFGDDRMGAVVDRIAREGHDIQLHLHPCWLHFRDSSWRTLERLNDSCAGRTPAELDDMLRYSCDVFARWGLPRPLALRTGGFHCDRNV
jgi:hypothetical protein